LEQLPGQQQGIVNSIWTSFAAAPPELRCFILRGMLVQCDLTQLSFLAQSLSSMIRINFIAALPIELSFKVLSYLDAQSLCRTAQVSKLWRFLSDDDIIWQRMCEQHTDRRCIACGWGLSALVNPADLPIPSTLRPRTRWKYIYASRLIVERNWREGRFMAKVLTGHTNGVMCLQMDDQYLITGSYDRTARIWDIETGQLIRTLTGHTSGIRALQFDKKVLITASMDSTLRVWDYRTGQCLTTLTGHTDSVICLHLDKRRLASGSADHTIRVWDFQTTTGFTLTGHCDWVNSVKFYKTYLVSCSDDTTIRIWDLPTKTCVRTLFGHVQPVQCIQLVPRSSRMNFTHPVRSEDDCHPVIVSGSLDNTIRIWDIQTGTCIRTLCEHMEGVWSLAIDNLRMVSGAHDKTVKIWNKDTGECMHTLVGHNGPVTCVALGDTKIASGSEDGSIRIWDFNTYKM
jgi:F-box and WD-40 domain protein MET30